MVLNVFGVFLFFLIESEWWVGDIVRWNFTLATATFLGTLSC